MKECNDKEIKRSIYKLGLSGEFNINEVNKVLDIITIGDKRLRQKNIDVKDIEEKYSLIINMVNTLYDSQGCGLAAPQIGENINLFIVEVVMKDDDGEDYIEYPLTVFINPIITKYSEETELDYEGCLSIGDFYAIVERSESIEIEYTNIFGERIKEEVDGFSARAIQHEYDHLSGVLYTDIADIKTLTTRDNLSKKNSNE